MQHTVNATNVPTTLSGRGKPIRLQLLLFVVCTALVLLITQIVYGMTLRYQLVHLNALKIELQPIYYQLGTEQDTITAFDRRPSSGSTEGTPDSYLRATSMIVHTEL